MAVTINNQHGVYDNVKDTFPQSSALTGTVSTKNNGLLVGSGTAFSTELQVGEWIFDDTNNEIRQITGILSDTVLQLRSAFTNTLTGATVKRTPRQTYRSFSISIDSAGTAKIDNVELPASTSDTFSFIGNISGGKRPDPIIIDSTANSNKVYLTLRV